MYQTLTAALAVAFLSFGSCLEDYGTAGNGAVPFLGNGLDTTYDAQIFLNAALNANATDMKTSKNDSFHKIGEQATTRDPSSANGLSPYSYTWKLNISDVVSPTSSQAVTNVVLELVLDDSHVQRLVRERKKLMGLFLQDLPLNVSQAGEEDGTCSFTLGDACANALALNFARDPTQIGFPEVCTQQWGLSSNVTAFISLPTPTFFESDLPFTAENPDVNGFYYPEDDDEPALRVFNYTGRASRSVMFHKSYGPTRPDDMLTYDWAISSIWPIVLVETRIDDEDEDEQEVNNMEAVYSITCLKANSFSAGSRHEILEPSKAPTPTPSTTSGGPTFSVSALMPSFTKGSPLIGAASPSKSCNTFFMASISILTILFSLFSL